MAAKISWPINESFHADRRLKVQHQRKEVAEEEANLQAAYEAANEKWQAAEQAYNEQHQDCEVVVGHSKMESERVVGNITSEKHVDKTSSSSSVGLENLTPKVGFDRSWETSESEERVTTDNSQLTMNTGYTIPKTDSCPDTRSAALEYTEVLEAKDQAEHYQKKLNDFQEKKEDYAKLVDHLRQTPDGQMVLKDGTTITLVDDGAVPDKNGDCLMIEEDGWFGSTTLNGSGQLDVPFEQLLEQQDLSPNDAMDKRSSPIVNNDVPGKSEDTEVLQAMADAGLIEFKEDGSIESKDDVQTSISSDDSGNEIA